jgi:hypothetical protein
MTAADDRRRIAPGFRGLSGKSDIWIPRTMAPTLTYSEYLTTPQHFIMVIARLKDDVSFATANAELAAIGDRFADFPSTDDAVWGAVARSLGDARVDTIIRRSGFALLGAAACVLLIGCVNVASLLLARGRSRQREIAVRLAIGSGRWRIVRQLMTEGALSATAAGVAGVILARWGVAFFTATSRTRWPVVTAATMRRWRRSPNRRSICGYSASQSSWRSPRR